MRNKFIAAAIFSFAIVFLPIIVFGQDTTTTAPAPEVVQPAPMPQPTEPQKPMPIMEEEEMDRRDFVEPREIQEVLRQIKDLKREAARILKKAAKANLAAEVGQINALVSQITALETMLKSGTISRDTLQDFYESRAWEELNNIRVKIEMPNEIKMMERELAKLEKMISKKTFVVDGVDMAGIKEKIAEIRTALNLAKENLASNNLEEAGEALRDVHENGFHPGEMMNVLNRLSEMTKQIRKIRSEEIRNDIKEILAPVFEAINAGDFREANMLLNEIDRDLWKIMSTLKNKSTINSDIRTKMDKLEQKLQQKLEQQNNNSKGQQSYLDGRNFSASLLQKIGFWLGL